MAVAPMGAVFRQFSRLFAGGSVSGLTEGQLLDRFVKTRDESAFTAIVERFGPMVLGVCRKLLTDPNAAEDAFQATFLVLVKRAGSIRDGDLLGNWLYGVALKVARRARADLAKKQAREKGGEDVDARPGHDLSAAADYDVGPILHEELGRLPENYRKPLVLCFLDGRSHEEAAKLLRWPVGTVKGRISRGKELLRERLGRRGVTITSAAIAAALAKTASATVSPILIDSTVKAAMGIAAGGVLVAGTYSATAVTLSEGVVASMSMTKFKLIAVGLVALGTVGAGAGVMARQQEAKPIAEKVEARKTTTVRDEVPIADPPVLQKAEARNDAIKSPRGNSSEIRRSDTSSDVRNPPVVRMEERVLQGEPEVGALPPPEELAARRVRIAEELFNLKTKMYASGATNLNSVLVAAKNLADARIAADEGSRVRALETDVKLLRAIVKQADSRMKEGSLALADFKEAESNLVDAEILLAKARSGEVVAARAKPGENPDDEDSPEMNKKIREALAKQVAMPFAAETPLEEVIKYIKTTTADGMFQQGIPIYVDPVGLSEAEKTMASPITINLEGIPLRTSLRLLLKQIDLSYYIKDGLLIISSPKSDTFPESAMTAIEKAERAERKAEEREARAKAGPGGGGFGGGFR